MNNDKKDDLVEVFVKKGAEVLFEGSFEKCSISQHREIEKVYTGPFGKLSELKPVHGSEKTTIVLS